MDIVTGNISDLIFRSIPAKNMGEVSVDSSMLNVRMECDGKKTLGIISQITGISMVDIRPVIVRLLDLKLIEEVLKQATARTVDMAFFEFLKHNLSQAIGPIAEVLIEDEIADMGYGLNNFPPQRVAELVDIISKEIQREEKRADFKRNMVKKIMEMGM